MFLTIKGLNPKDRRCGNQCANTSSGWWFQPILKKNSQIGRIISPGRGENKTCLKPPPSHGWIAIVTDQSNVRTKKWSTGKATIWTKSWFKVLLAKINHKNNLPLLFFRKKCYRASANLIVHLFMFGKSVWLMTT